MIRRYGYGCPREAAGVLVRARDTGRLLLGLRSPQVQNHPCTWAPFGGGVEPGEVSRDAAMRELFEEAQVALSDEQVTSVPIHVDEHAGGRFSLYLGDVIREVPPEVNWESTAAGWFSVDRLPRPMHPRFAKTIEVIGPRLRRLVVEVGTPR